MNAQQAILFDLPDAVPRHPAQYSWEILPVLERMARPYAKVLDVFAGTGVRLLSIRPDAYLNEIEPKWAAISQRQTDRSFVGDAQCLRWADGEFDAVITSPVYGNRMADHHNAKDGSRRMTYRHCLGEPLQPNNAGEIEWGHRYQNFHGVAWLEVRRVLRLGGGFILNVKDHIRDGQRVDVTGWHIDWLCRLGFRLIEHAQVDTPGMGFGQNGDKRMPYESVIHFVLETEQTHAHAD
jgi:hypothetical protein